MSDKITINDIRRAGHCVKGAREWFERHDLDFREFVKNGIDEEDLLRIGDGLATNVVEHKRKLERNG